MNRILYVAGITGLLAGCAAAPTSRSEPLAMAMSRPVSPTSVSTPNPAPNTVVIDNFSFSPPTLTVAAGTTVTWINHDDVPHTVTSDQEPRTLNSPVLDTDGKYTFTFTAAGTYDYYCTVHPRMTGKVIVKDGLNH